MITFLNLKHDHFINNMIDFVRKANTGTNFWWYINSSPWQTSSAGWVTSQKMNKILLSMNLLWYTSKLFFHTLADRWKMTRLTLTTLSAYHSDNTSSLHSKDKQIFQVMSWRNNKLFHVKVSLLALYLRVQKARLVRHCPSQALITFYTICLYYCSMSRRTIRSNCFLSNWLSSSLTKRLIWFRICNVCRC
jgi:hypothetical protein